MMQIDDPSLDADTTNTAAPPIEFGGDIVTWAMWLYYGESRTQSEVAKALGVSRASVANYLAEARKRGLVSISVAPEAMEHVTLARQLAAKYGLVGAHILPRDLATTDDAIALRRRLGMAAAVASVPFLKDNCILGVAWGRTMVELGNALPERDLPSTTVIQVSGSSLGDADSSPEACTALIAGRLGARCRNLHAPAVLGSAAIRTALMAEPSIVRHIEMARSCATVIYGVGEISATTTWADTDYITEDIAADYIAKGAVGVLIGRFIGTDGAEIPGQLEGRQIGMELADLQAVKTRICVSGGPAKMAATRATLAGHYATHLVTDAPTADALMSEAP